MKIKKMATKMAREQYYLARYKKARSIADLWMSILEAAQHYTCSSRNLFYWTSQSQGAQKNARVYDTTAVAAVRKFVSKVQSAITPAQMTWALLKAGPVFRAAANEDSSIQEEINEQLQIRTDIIFDYIKHSSFDLAINECYYDLAIGTAALLCNEGPDNDPLRFSSVPLARLAIEESVSGLIDSNYRWWDEIKIIEILQMWPKAKLTLNMRSLYENDPNAIVKNLFEGCIDTFGHTKSKFCYFVMCDSEIILEEDVDSSPWIVFRWSKINNEVYGRGPVLDALPSILTLNEMVRLELTTANFNASKPFMGMSDGVFQPWTFKLQPNTIIPVAPNQNGQFPLMPIPDNSPPVFVQLTVQDLRNQINVLLYADPLGPLEAPTKTATEMALRQRNLAEEIGPVYTRLQKEFLSRLMERIIYVLQKKGLLEKIVIKGREIIYQYQSPLSMDQGKLDVERVGEWYSFMVGVYGETAPMFLAPTRLPFWAADKMGVDPTLLGKEEEVMEMLKQRAELEQKKEQMAMKMGNVA